MHKLRNDSDLPTAELLQKYRDGTLTPDERAQIEALRSRDPFVADALAGLDKLADGSTFATDVAVLRTRLYVRTRARRPWRYPLRVAAALVLLLVASYLLYTWLPTAPLTTKSETPAANAEASAHLYALPAPVASLPPVGLVDTLAMPLPRSLATVAPPPSARLKLAYKLTPRMLPRAPAERTPVAEVKPKPPAVDSPPVRTRQSTASETAFAPNAQRAVTGQVIDQADGEPLPGVNVLVKGTTEGTITDVEGKFSLPVPENQRKLAFSAVGYASQEIAVSPQGTAQIALEADVPALSEVVVVGYGGADTKQISYPIQAAQPTEGMAAFKRYLRKNVRYPDEWSAEDRKTVKVSFKVQSSGSLTDFMIEKSASEWFDQEAIRLIREGPDWTAAKRDSGQLLAQRVVVEVLFRR